MNKPIRKVAAFLAVLFAAIFLNLNWVQVVQGDRYSNDPQNARVLLNEYASPRGQIVVQGHAIAESRATTDELKYRRVYPKGRLYAPVTGFYSFAATPSRFLGTTGIETAENSVLSGKDPHFFGVNLTDLLTGRNPRGGSVELTLNRAVQQVAYTNLIKSSTGRSRRGAVVAMDPTTGAILAAVSTPSYDPNALSSHNATAITKTYQRLSKDPSQPLLNRAFNQLYPPGSTFKVVVSAAALKLGIRPNSRLLSPNAYFPETGRTAKACPHGADCVENFGGETCENGSTATLAFALAKSCNTTFAALAVERLGGQRIGSEAKLFGFDPTSPAEIPLPVARSTVGTRADLTAAGFLARTAFGQQDVRMTPLQGAMMASAVADNGTLMRPYLVRRELAPDLSVLSETRPSQLSQVIDPTLDRDLQSMMQGVVTAPEGTGHPADITDIDGVSVAGKTGTADTGRTDKNGNPEPPDAWFIGYATKNGAPKIAVAVIIENGGVQGNETTGGEAAAPVAKAVMETYLKGSG
jgi:peptidoglycan glycosyltransferase